MVLPSHLLRIYQGGQILRSCLLRERSHVSLMNELRGRNRQLTKANVLLRPVKFTKQRDIYQLQGAQRPR